MKFLKVFGCSVWLFVIGFGPAHALPVEGHRILISTNSPLAVEAGKGIAQAGGNAVDVAVATALALSVASPYYASFGGGGFALVKQGNKPVEALDFREKAPQKTGPDFYLKKPNNASVDGGTAVGVPGIPAGLYELHKKYGKLSWNKLFAAPLKYAESGYAVSGEFVKNVQKAGDYLDKTGKHYFMNGKNHYKPGQNFKQPQIVKVLQSLRDQTASAFYQGEIAADVVSAVTKSGGVMSLDDMKKYKVRWLKPMRTNFRGHVLYMMPPPSSGGVVMQTAFYLIEAVGLPSKAYLSGDELHLFGEVMSRAFRARELLGDPEFHQNPLDKILNTDYLQRMSKNIDPAKVKRLTQVIDKYEELETTHISVLDKDGNAAGLTLTANRNFGSGVVTEKFGIVLNNQMDDFTVKPNQPNFYGLIQGPSNEIRPGKRPLSSMTPTLVERDGKIIMSVGAQGGPKIISGLIQVIYRILINNFDIEKAIASPRVHQQFLPQVLYIDEKSFSPEVLANLKTRGHTIEETWMGRVYGVRMNSSGNLEASGDPRGEFGAGGI